MIDPSTSGHYIGDCRELLAQLPDGCIQTCITSPPYWGLRDYGVDGQIGLEPTPEAYVAELVKVFAEVRRVLRDDGTLWLNLGDSYANGKVGRSDEDERSLRRRNQCWGTAKTPKSGSRADQGRRRRASDLKTKDLVGIPWEIAFALRADGWYLRCDIIWSKPNAMPESVTDRPTKAHEYLFLLSKREKYFYDADAIKEPVTGGSHPRGHGVNPKARHDAAGSKQNRSFSAAVTGLVQDRNKRSVWTIASQPYDGAHFAVMPAALVDPCVLAGSRPGDVVLDPFFGSGTVGAVAEKHGRKWIGFDLNPAYAELQKERTAQRSLVLKVDP